ncbi:MAG: VTT domain-containing protein [Bacilli bacterium]
MQEFIDVIINNLVIFLANFGVLAGVLIILLESILPILPLAFFIALNIFTFGNVLGFLISYFATCLGCILSFILFRYFFSNKLEAYIQKRHSKKLDILLKRINNFKFSELTILIALPFSPAFLINIAAGLSKMSFKKFLSSILIGKTCIIYFWGYVGKSLLESITDLDTIIKVSLMLVFAYLVSKLLEKKIKIE